MIQSRGRKQRVPRRKIFKILLAMCLGVGHACLAQEVRKSSPWAEDADFVANAIRSTHPIPFRRISAQRFDQELVEFKAAASHLNDDEATVRLIAIVGANKFREAIAAYQKVLQISPTNWNAGAERTAIAKMQGNLGDAK